jgi:hypothetical protein
LKLICHIKDVFLDIRFKHSTKYSTKSASAFTNGEETTDSIISKILSNLSCLVFDRSSVMKKIKYASKFVFSYHWTCYIINFLKCFGWLSPDFSAKRKYCAIFLVHWKREYFFFFKDYLLVDCTSRDGRQMLDAGVHLSDKRTLLMKTHIPFQTQYKIFYQIRFCFYNILNRK